MHHLGVLSVSWVDDTVIPFDPYRDFLCLFGYHRLLMATGGLHDQSGRKEAHAYESGWIAIDDLGFYLFQND